eukprot:3697130-Pleurochrysis_carterae.AAC.1
MCAPTKLPVRFSPSSDCPYLLYLRLTYNTYSYSQNQGGLRKARNEGAGMRRESSQSKAKCCRYARHVSFYSNVNCMRGEHSQSVREVLAAWRA